MVWEWEIGRFPFFSGGFKTLPRPENDALLHQMFCDVSRGAYSSQNLIGIMKDLQIYQVCVLTRVFLGGSCQQALLDFNIQVSPEMNEIEVAAGKSQCQGTVNVTW